MMIVKMKSGVEFHAGLRFPNSTMTSSCYDYVINRTDPTGRVEKGFYYTGRARCRARVFEMIKEWERYNADQIVSIQRHVE